MERHLLLLMSCSVAFASESMFLSVPESVKLTSSNSTTKLLASQLSDLNALLLGLSAKPVNGLEVESNLFLRPRALVVISAIGIDTLPMNEPGFTLTLENDGFDESSLDKKLASAFGSDFETVKVSRDGITGLVIAQNDTASEAAMGNIKTKSPVLRKQLEDMYRLFNNISSGGAKLQKHDIPDIYYVTISCLETETVDNDAIRDIEQAIQKLFKAFLVAYNHRTIFEVLTLSEVIKPSGISEEHLLVRRKRASDASETDSNLKTWRERLNVYVFVGTDYPAIFAIFAGLSITLALAVLYTVVAMMSMDPSKDSIIYRMTTTRIKKA